MLDSEWKIRKEDASFRNLVQETEIDDKGRINHRWVPRREMPSDELWFENVWASFRKGEIYR